MSPRRSAAGPKLTRQAVLDETIDEASLHGLDAVTIGRLAERLGMSKAGVVGPFGSKESLQLAALEQAVALFRREIWDPSAGRKPGLTRLEALAEAWLDYLSRDVFPGGCFLTQAAGDFDGRPGPVRDAVRGAFALWQSVLEQEVERAVEQGELPEGVDPAQIAFELAAIAQGVNQRRQLMGDEGAVGRGRTAMRRILFLD